ncbi:S1C family serine protease [Solicola gregarius]|uniref:Trypsin-like peptidase domain-containing protein n=1 Tax=Solicola gregarius TaxID=2908642 RepID=A0AA46YN14_9ACTN|nr:trypsin-like peptidase domain-containing protein [Solicola gregarius]UYM07154.1 trypsin-like peptidase domain-containing protein [Solicola gregarius]
MSAGDMNDGNANDGRRPERQPSSDPAAAGPRPPQPYGPPAGGPGQAPPPGYGRPEPTASFTHRYPAPDRNAEPAGPPMAPQAPADADRNRRPRLGLVVAAALVAGLVGGGAGAAGINALNDDESSGLADSAAGTSLSEPVSATDKKLKSGTIEAVAAKVRPSVVQINVSGSDMADSGTGIIISKDGMILTNNHVVAAAAEGGTITVAFDDNSTAEAEIVGRDPVTDIAVIQAKDASDLDRATLGKSADLKVGQDVVAVGSPFGLESTVTSGIVSALNRPVSAGDSSGETSNVYPAIQTDAAINPGNSGGPLVDMNGNVVGINSSIRSNSSGSEAGSIGLGFAIPIDLARNIATQLIDGQSVEHAQIGITVTDSKGSDDITTNGARIKSVEGGSPGSDAGLKQGDVITKLNNDVITGSQSLVATIRGYAPGDKVEIAYTRDGEDHTTDVELGSDGGDTP